jgi:hypothetical protein
VPLRATQSPQKYGCQRRTSEARRVIKWMAAPPPPPLAPPPPTAPLAALLTAIGYSSTPCRSDQGSSWQVLYKFGNPVPGQMQILSLVGGWAADRLERRRLPHPSACPFCDQAQESITHLLLGCVLARTIWVVCLRWRDREDRLPLRGISLADWLQSWCGRVADVRHY